MFHDEIQPGQKNKRSHAERKRGLNKIFTGVPPLFIMFLLFSFLEYPAFLDCEKKYFWQKRFSFQIFSYWQSVHGEQQI
jgi:hypothetical protein